MRIIPLVMIVEDEAMTALWLSACLKKMDCEVLPPVATGEDALQVAEEKNPDVIFMDINLAGDMDGITAAEKINMHHHIPVVFTTGYSAGEIMVRAKKLKPFAYIIKPLNAGMLRSVMNSLADRE